MWIFVTLTMLYVMLMIFCSGRANVGCCLFQIRFFASRIRTRIKVFLTQKTYTKFSKVISGMCISDPRSWILIRIHIQNVIPLALDPGFNNSNKREGEKICCPTFFVATNTKLKMGSGNIDPFRIPGSNICKHWKYPRV